MKEKILVTGAAGQIGSELVPALREKYGRDKVVAMFHNTRPTDELKKDPVDFCDAADKEALKAIITKHNISIIYHLAGVISAVGEKNPELAWKANFESLKNVLDLGVELKIKKIFWPSSIAAFGPTTPRINTPQRTVMEPSTIYGVAKLAAENLCNYYHRKYGLDVRSLRYPGLISWKTEPGGGTTDYAVAIFYEALKTGRYTCFLRKETRLPMMYMDDAIRGTLELMDAEPSALSVRTSYNYAAISFSAGELAAEIKKHISHFECGYAPDERQKIADSWPESIDDSEARKDWGWQPRYLLPQMADEMLAKLREKFSMEGAI